MAEFSDVQEVLEKLVDRFQTQQQMNKFGLAMIRIIKTRTRSWRDVEGRRFEDYSKAHRRRRVALDLAVSPGGKNTDSMMVMDSASGMMQKIDAIVANDFSNVVLDITDPVKKKIASYHNIKGVGVKGQHLRKFWGLHNKEWKVITKIAAVDIDNILADLTEEAQ